MTIASLVALGVGLLLLVVGAESLVRGAAAVASRLAVPPVIIGLTVVAYGTSAPELAVSVGAGASGRSDVALGNIVGSNIGNALMILGITALISRLAVSQRVIRIDLPILAAVSLLVLAMALDGSIGRLEGSLLLVGLLAYTGWLIRTARRERPDVLAEYEDAVDLEQRPVARAGLAGQVGLIVAGLAGLVIGARTFVGGATDIADALGVSDLVIGLTVVAIGTSLPELATSVLAAIRGQRDIAIGNVVGSNLFNLLGVLGATALVTDAGVLVSSSSLRLDLPVMLAATVVLLPLFWSGFELRRREGALMLVGYAVYVGYLVATST